MFVTGDWPGRGQAGTSGASPGRPVEPSPMAWTWRLVEEVADVEAVADVVAADVGVVDDLLAVAVGEDAALADHVAAVGDLERLAELVVGQQDADVVGLDQAADLVLDLGDGLGVDAGERLVEHDQLRLGDQRPGDLQPPALAAGDAVGLGLADLGQAELVEQLVLAVLALAAVHPGRVSRIAIRLSSTESCLKTLESCAR